ncbi:MAG: efflux RND transporter permease subunit [Pseudomonadota bacterium]
MGKLIRLGANYPWQTLLIIVVITLVAALQLPNLRVIISVEGMMLRDDPTAAVHEELKKRFPAAEGLVVVFHHDTPFSPEQLKTIKGFIKDTEQLPFVSRTVSLFNVNHITSEESEIKSTPFLEPLPETTEDFEARVANAAANPLLANNLISPDGHTFAVRVFLDRPKDDRGFDVRAVTAVESILAGVRPQFADSFQLGTPVLRDAITSKIKEDQKQILGGAVAVLLLVLSIILRRVNGALIPLLTSVVSIVWTLAFMAAMGIPINVMTSIVPALLVIIGSTEDIHLVAEYYSGIQSGLKKPDALDRMAKHMGTAILITAITTYLGFVSIATNNIELLQQFGVAASSGIMINFLITAALVPAWLKLTDRSKAPTGPVAPPDNSRELAESADELEERPLRNRAVAATLLLVTGLAIWGITKVEVDNDPMSHFDPTDPFIQNIHNLSDYLAGVETFSVVLRSRIEDTFLKLRYLNEVKELQEYLDRTDRFDKTLSFADYVSVVNVIMEEDDSGDLYLPDEDDILREYMLFIDHKDISDYVTRDFSESRIIVRHRIGSSRELEDIVEGIKEFARNNTDAGLDVAITGDAILRTHAAHAMAYGQAKSLGFMIVVIWALISMLFVNAKAGALAVLPNLFPIVVLFGVMGFHGIPLDTSTVMVAAIALGICIDDTMHFMVRYHHHTQKFGNQDLAIRQTVRDESRPIIATSLALALGFSVFVLSSFPPVVHFGLLSALVMMVALVSVFVILPMLLKTVSLVTIYDMLALELRREVLDHCSLFHGMKPSQIKRLVLISNVLEFETDAVIVNEGASDKEMYVILEGRVDVRKRQPDGDQKTMAQLKCSEVFGEMALVTQQPRTASIIAIEPTKVLSFAWEDIEKINRFSPRIASRLFRNLSAVLSARLAAHNTH